MAPIQPPVIIKSHSKIIMKTPAADSPDGLASGEDMIAQKNSSITIKNNIGHNKNLTKMMLGFSGLTNDCGFIMI